MTIPMSRRQWLRMSMGTAAAVASSRFLVAETPVPGDPAFRPLYETLDRFVEQYMRDMCAPGMTLALADVRGVQRIATYGFANVDRRTRVRPGDLFQIGSISKSMTANCLLQLQDEGRVDLHKPVTDHLPWLRLETPFGPITPHHLLTHSSGLPENPPVFPSDPAQKLRPGYPPGARFHYSNLAYRILGHLIRTLDGRPLAESFRRRIFAPLGMTQSEPIITLDTLDRVVDSYSQAFFDRPQPRSGRLTPAQGLIYTEAAGCVLSTPRDMGLYLQMLARGGQGPGGRLVSEASFAQIVKGYVKAEVFGPTASYGYGFAVDVQEGHRVVRHTGGMNSFASSLVVDLDSGVGAFASINAMQGYRPVPVTNFALQLMRAVREARPLPPIPPPAPAAQHERAGDFAGTWVEASGATWEVTARGRALFLLHEGRAVPMEPALDIDNGFLLLDPELDHYPMVFTRADPKDPASPFVEAGWGGKWFTRRATPDHGPSSSLPPGRPSPATTGAGRGRRLQGLRAQGHALDGRACPVGSLGERPVPGPGRGGFPGVDQLP